MTDRPAPKAKKQDKVEKTPGPKLVAKDIVPAIGHNSNNGERHPEVIKKVGELMDYQQQKKSIAKAERDIRNSLKTEFGILASSVARVIAMLKLDPDVRVQVETNYADLNKMLGYQPSLDFSGGLPTSASLKAQPGEAKLRERNTEPVRAPQGEQAGDGFTVGNDDDADESGIITREG